MAKMSKEVEKILNLLDDVSSLTANLKSVTTERWQTVDKLCDQIREIITA
jgi:hypothetical protein